MLMCVLELQPYAFLHTEFFSFSCFLFQVRDRDCSEFKYNIKNITVISDINKILKTFINYN